MKKEDYREFVKKLFVQLLEKEVEGSWEKGWNTSNAFGLMSFDNINGVSKKKYIGKNQMVLAFERLNFNFTDNRWYTFNQIRKLGYKLIAGSKGIPVVYWSIYDKDKKKIITQKEYNDLVKDMDELEAKNRFRWINKYSCVFNASCVEELKTEVVEEIKEENVSEEEIKIEFIEEVKKIQEGMGIEISHSPEGGAYYSPKMDSITLPIKETFYSKQEYNATALHELAHATGHKNRLGREEIINPKTFGTNAYAKEELVAEISSAMMGYYSPNDDKENHLRYVQSWLSEIKNKKDYLFQALKSAEEVVKYFEGFLRA